jgi:exopolysaccharide production protein ExoQ
LGYQHIRRNFGMYTIGAILSYALLEGLFNLSQLIIISSGRDMNLSGRTELWDVVLKMDQSPILGYGFESFWLGDRLAKLWEMYYFKPNMAHNGYLEIFLNLGGVGLGLFIGFLVSCYFKSLKALKLPTAERAPARIDIDRFRMAFLLSFSLFNVTEGGFRSLNFIYVFFLLFLISYPLVREKIPHPSRVGLAKAQPLSVGTRVRTPVAPL